MSSARSHQEQQHPVHSPILRSVLSSGERPSEHELFFVSVGSFILKLVPRLNGIKQRKAAGDLVKLLIETHPKRYKNFVNTRAGQQVCEFLGKVMFGKMGHYNRFVKKESFDHLMKLLSNVKSKRRDYKI